MKLLLNILIAFLITATVEVTQANDLTGRIFRTPEKVIHTLDSIYPGPKNVQWSKKRKCYTAHFIYQSRNFAITFDRKGRVVASVEEIPFESLPESIKEKFTQFYNSYKVLMVLKRATDSKLEYDIEIIQGKEHYILNYHSKGYLIQQYNVTRTDRSRDFSD